MNKNVEQHLDELIEFYSESDFDDISDLKKLIIRNLKDVKRRYIKYDKPVRNKLNKAIEFCKKYDFILKWQLLEILEGEDKDE